MTDRAAWLAGLGVGDEVCVERGHYGLDLGRVLRITPSRQIIVKGAYERELRFRADGHESSGSAFGRAILKPATSEIRDKIEQKDLVYKFQHYRWDQVPLETLRRVVLVVEEGK